MSQSKTRTVIAWIFQVLSALIVLAAASGKLRGSAVWVKLFHDWGYPDGFYFVVGVLEAIGAVGLLIPRVAGTAAGGLLVIMVAAIVTHLIHGDGLDIVRPLVVMALLAPVLWLRGFAFGSRSASRSMPAPAAVSASRPSPGK